MDIYDLVNDVDPKETVWEETKQMAELAIL